MSNKALVIKEVYWHPNKAYWIKCNTSGIALGSPRVDACAGIFHDSYETIISYFSKRLGINYAFHGDIFDVMMAIEISYSRGWHLLG